MKNFQGEFRLVLDVNASYEKVSLLSLHRNTDNSQANLLSLSELHFMSLLYSFFSTSHALYFYLFLMYMFHMHCNPYPPLTYLPQRAIINNDLNILVWDVKKLTSMRLVAWLPFPSCLALLDA